MLLQLSIETTEMKTFMSRDSHKNVKYQVSHIETGIFIWIPGIKQVNPAFWFE